MNIAIIGAGNMGAAIIHGLLNASAVNPSQLLVVDTNEKALLPLQKLNIKCYHRIVDIQQEINLVIIAVKPWLAKGIMHKLKAIITPSCVIASIAAGISLAQMREELAENPLFRVMPNTAIEVHQSMSFICAENADDAQIDIIKKLFLHLGKVLFIDEEQMPAATALASCGVAFAMRYISANMRAAVEIGLNPEMAKNTMLQTLQGVVSLLTEKNSHPETEIDKVTTPKGLTIKGLNELEHNNFTSAIIKALKASL
ncbi:MAG: pyrroline-5-carboxylate reductase [Bacteroidales bacterium]